MNWLLVAIVAQFVLGSSSVMDKVLLGNKYKSNPFGYTFWLGVMGLAAIVFVPFGFRFLPIGETALALGAGAVFMLAMLFYYLALEEGEASNELILIGALSPLFTYAASALILGITLASYEIAAFTMLTFGGFLLFFVEKPKHRLRSFGFAALSALCFGLSNTLSKSVFLASNFATGFVLMKIGGALLVMLFIIFPKIREKITVPSDYKPVARVKYVGNRIYASLGSILVYYAILLGSPPLVDASSNLKYVFIFFGGWLFLKERFSGWALKGKLAALAVISSSIFVIGVGDYLKSTAPDPGRPVTWGITFSGKFARDLSLDPRETYEAIVKDLGIRDLRLIAYWDEMEPNRTELRFEELDYQVKLAEENGARFILAVGRKTPRWPECHFPEWAKKLGESEQKEALFAFVGTVVQRYKTSPALKYTQVENEPFLAFGECSTEKKEFVKEEIDLVKSLDPSHPILVTDSGELGRWYKAYGLGDIFGTTMYRRVWSRFGQIDYPLPPEFFRLKEMVIRLLAKDGKKPIIVSELQAEPWFNKQIYGSTPEEQFQNFGLDYFKDTIRYAKATGFDEYYLWGAEWWYWLKVKQNHPEFWDYVKTLSVR